jgi:hypothetical protein
VDAAPCTAVERIMHSGRTGSGQSGHDAPSAMPASVTPKRTPHAFQGEVFGAGAGGGGAS